MRLLLDECIGHRSLATALAAAGHDVIRSVDSLGGAADDLAVFTFAQEQRRTVVTYNNADFKALAVAGPDHAGLLLVYLSNKPNDMKTSDIIRAIGNVESNYANGLANEIIVLNQFQWPRVSRKCP